MYWKEKRLSKAQKTTVYERAHAELWKGRAVADRAVLAERFERATEREKRRQRKIAMGANAMEAKATGRDLDRVLGETMEATRQEAERVLEEVTQVGRMHVGVAVEKTATKCDETAHEMAVPIHGLMERV